jgi:hypothetical protein
MLPMLHCLLHPAQILTKQAWQKDIAPKVLALSVGQMGDRRPKDSGGANHHYKTFKEIMLKETSKQIFLHSTSKWWLLEWLAKVWKGEVKSCFPFLLFQISFIYFLFCQMQRWAKTNMPWKGRKENGGFGGDRENSNANGERRVEKKMG